MRRALLGRLAFAIALVLVAFVGAYVLTELAPGDPLAGENVTRPTLDKMKAARGLDAPLWSRFATRLVGLAVLDLGTSLRYDQPVLTLVAHRTVLTLQAGVAALLLAIALGIPGGVLASRSRSAVVRHAIGITSIVLLSLPALVIAIILAMLTSGAGVPPLLVMVIALGLPAAALLERLQAQAMDAAQRELCLDAARARGVPRHVITWRHAWPLSLPGVLGLGGTLAGQLLSGALAIEVLTSRNGLGRLTFDALSARDVNLAAGCAGAVALLVGLVTLASDAIQMWMDPRVAVLDDATANREATAP